MTRIREWLRHFSKAPRISPAGFVQYAGLILMLYAMLDLLGLRKYVSIASGTPLPAFGSEQLGVALGVAYALLYFAAAVVLPILLIAAAAWRLGRHVLQRRRRPAETQS